MKVYVPDYYPEFKCIADKCRHTCCRGWEVEIDEESRARFEKLPDVAPFLLYDEDGACQFRLIGDETCPFLQEDGLCRMIVKYGEDVLCQICADHPRFRNYWSDRIEMGLGLVCEEAARLILGREHPMRMVLLENELSPSEGDLPREVCDETYEGELPEDEQWLMNLRDDLIRGVAVPAEAQDGDLQGGPLARLKEYLLFRYIPDALYDDRLEERIRFADHFTDLVIEQMQETDGSFDSLVEVVRQLSYDIEYDEDELERILSRA